MTTVTYAVETRGLTVSYHGKTALKDVSVSLPAGQLIGIVGPNGAGKSTFIKAVMELVRRDAGTVRVLGRPLQEVRKKVAYVPQRNAIDWNFPVLVADVVLMGRYPHLGWIRRPTKHDREIAERCLEMVGLSHLKRRQIGELSGGQQQRVFLARALAQEADLFFFDEPFVGVDAATETAMLNILRDLRDAGKTVIVVHHDLNKVQQVFDILLLLNRRVIACGPTKDVFTAENLSQTYAGAVTLLPAGEQMLVVNR